MGVAPRGGVDGGVVGPLSVGQTMLDHVRDGQIVPPPLDGGKVISNTGFTTHSFALPAASFAALSASSSEIFDISIVGCGMAA